MPQHPQDDKAPDVQTHRNDEAEPSLYCPRCDSRLTSMKCKLICPKCGYYMSCADYY